MGKLTITQKQARRFILRHQGLLPPRSMKKEEVIDHIKKVGCIQFDPLNVVGRNPELVLQSRVSGFHPAMLEELLYRDRKLVDAWDKQMSIYSVEDWPYYRRYREKAKESHGRNLEQVRRIMPQIRKLLEERGPLSSIDMDFNERVDWYWAPANIAKAALENMYMSGELVIHHKVNTRRVYDFADKHIAKELLSMTDPNEEDAGFEEWFVLRRVGGVGLLWGKSGDVWLGNSRIKSKERQATIERLLAQGRLREVLVENISTPFYIRSIDRHSLEEVVAIDSLSQELPEKASIIAPLDNLLWDRKLIKTLFGFDYVWEVYKPADERKYGYYVLPVMYGDKFAARFEPGFDKESRTLIIKGWWWESGVKPTKKLQKALQSCFKDFMDYLGAEKLGYRNQHGRKITDFDFTIMD